MICKLEKISRQVKCKRMLTGHLFEDSANIKGSTCTIADSIYSTNRFKHQSLPYSARQRVADAAGQHAEWLAYLFSVIDRPSALRDALLARAPTACNSKPHTLVTDVPYDRSSSDDSPQDSLSVQVLSNLRLEDSSTSDMKHPIAAAPAPDSTTSVHNSLFDTAVLVVAASAVTATANKLQGPHQASEGGVFLRCHKRINKPSPFRLWHPKMPSPQASNRVWVTWAVVDQLVAIEVANLLEQGDLKAVHAAAFHDVVLRIRPHTQAPKPNPVPTDLSVKSPHHAPQTAAKWGWLFGQCFCQTDAREADCERAHQQDMGPG